MTATHTTANHPALPMSAVGGAFPFSFRHLLGRSPVRAVARIQAAALEIHNMNALYLSEQAHVHIMNFVVADQKPSCEIHIMNFMNSKQVEPPSVWWKPVGAGQSGKPSTYKGARNVMS